MTFEDYCKLRRTAFMDAFRAWLVLKDISLSSKSRDEWDRLYVEFKHWYSRKH